MTDAFMVRGARPLMKIAPAAGSPAAIAGGKMAFAVS